MTNFKLLLLPSLFVVFSALAQLSCLLLMYVMIFVVCSRVQLDTKPVQWFPNAPQKSDLPSIRTKRCCLSCYGKSQLYFFLCYVQKN